MSTEKNIRLWKHVEFGENWLQCDTSVLDDIVTSWYERREVLQNNSLEYKEFLSGLKREHAIETGIVERMYDLKKGITETFIKKGFVESYVSHDDTNIPVPQLLAHLSDHLDAVDFVFDVVKENRPLTVGFVKELHALVTRNQHDVEGIDQFGQLTKTRLLKGTFKEHENNPVRKDGTKVLYCPPSHVDAEMDTLIALYNEAESKEVHSIILSAWFHHAFTTIHPFQDGNGRVGRLLSSLILIKRGLFPFTVFREESKSVYIDALENADTGDFQPLVNYFSEGQKTNIEKALNLKEVSAVSSLDEVANIFSVKVDKWQKKSMEEQERLLDEARMTVFQFSLSALENIKEKLGQKLNGGVNLYLDSNSSLEKEKQHFYYGQIIQYAKKHGYYFNRSLPKAWLLLGIDLSQNKKYRLGITIHHFGYDVHSLAIGAFLEYLEDSEGNERIDKSLPLEIKPHVISISGDMSAKEKNIYGYIENAVTLTLAQIASEL